MLEGHGVLIDHAVPDVVEPVRLDPVELLRLVRAEVQGHLPHTAPHHSHQQQQPQHRADGS